MSDLMLGIKTLLTNAWKFFSQTDVPGTDISFAVFAVGLALIPVCFRFPQTRQKRIGMKIR